MLLVCFINDSCLISNLLYFSNSAYMSFGVSEGSDEVTSPPFQVLNSLRTEKRSQMWDKIQVLSFSTSKDGLGNVVRIPVFHSS